MISRRTLLIETAAAVTAPAIWANAQPAGAKKIGWLKIQDRNHTPGQLREFLEGLRTAGHEEGRTFAMEYRFADGQASRLTALARELVESGVHMILATSQPATDAARRATLSVPIIGRMTDDPVTSGAAISLSRPDGNVTGVYSLLEEMSAKRLALLKQAVPGLRKVGALMSLNRGSTAHWLAESRRAARDLGLDLHPMDVQSVDQLDALFAGAAADKVNGLLAFRNPTVVTHDRRVIELCTRYRLPGIFDAREFAEAGAFMSYGPNLDTIFRRLASYADRVLGGARAGELPIEQPAEFELVLNLRAARAMNIAIPDSILVSASTVID